MEKSKTMSLVDEEYLEKNNVSGLLSQALLQVAIFQPEEPFQFLTNHFEWEKSKTNPLKYCSTILLSQSYPQSTIEYGIHKTYLMLSQCSNDEDKMKCVTGSTYMDLVQLLCVELQREHPDEELMLLESIYLPPRNVLSFREFRAGVHCCLTYKSYISFIRVLYKEADLRVLPKSVAALLLNQVCKQIQLDTKVAPDQLLPAANEPMTLQEFVTNASELFWKNISIESIIQQINPV